jgi:hypothetical protein
VAIPILEEVNILRELLRRLTSLLTALMLVVSLAACATTPRDETIRVKCPACGYEFDAPAGD